MRQPCVGEENRFSGNIRFDALRWGIGTKSSEPGFVTLSTKVMMDCLAGPPQGGFKDIKMVAYRSWTSYTLRQYKPKPPVHYKTFGETFSYVPPMPDDVREGLEREEMMY